MAPAQQSRRFGSVAQRDRGRGYERRTEAGFQQTPRFEYRKNLVGPAQMAPGSVNRMGPIMAAMEANKRQRREEGEAANTQRRYGGGLYGASTRPNSRYGGMGGPRYTGGAHGVYGNYGGVRVNPNYKKPPQFRGVRSIGGVSAPGATTTYAQGRITTTFG